VDESNHRKPLRATKVFYQHLKRRSDDNTFLFVATMGQLKTFAFLILLDLSFLIVFNDLPRVSFTISHTESGVIMAFFPSFC